MEHGLYFHLPYCRSICPYCAFAKAPLHHADPERLLAALRRESDMARAEGSWDRPRTIFFGGGTPTALAPEDLRATLDWVRASWDLKRVREWTVEANPEGLTPDKLAILREAGVNRLSLGVQSLEPSVLRALGRIHKPERALGAIADAKRAGFGNMSVDLMVAVPGESEDGVLAAIEALVDLGVPHLSVYALQIEDGTPLAGKVERGLVTPLDQDVAADRYERIGERLSRAGYRHYEVSNWALPGFESRHNEGYWVRRPYLGLGPGAHSFDGAARWRNEEDVTRYYERVESGELPREDHQAVTGESAATEMIFLGLRRARGLKRRHAERLAGPALATWSEWARTAGAVRLDPPGRIRPTEHGLLVSHEISSDLLARAGRLDSPAPRC
jgi:putative oxygen-independent coproporphyrinogen III oxidase